MIPALAAVGKYATAIKVGAVAIAVVGVLGTVGVLYHQRESLQNKVTTLTGERDRLIDINVEQSGTITRLQEQRKVDEQTVSKLMKDLEAITKRDRQARKKLADLERDNADVRSYLSGAVPSALECVFNDSDCGQAGGGGAAPAGGAAPTVPAAGPR